MGLSAGTLHLGIAHALPAIAAVLSTTRGSPNVSLSRVPCCCCRAVSSEVGGELSSQPGYHECQIAVHQARTVVRCRFLMTASDCMGAKRGERTDK